MNPRVLRNYFSSNWQKYAWYGGLFVVLILALVWKLNTLVPGYSPGEVAAYQTGAESFHSLLNTPLNAPFYLVVKLLLFLHPYSYLDVRLASVIIGVVVLASFAWLLSSLNSRLTAVVGTLLFGLSAWFLHTARLGTPAILYFGVFLLVASGWWLKRSGKRWALITCFVTGSLLLYVPGMIWFIVAGYISQHKAINAAFKRELAAFSYSAVFFLSLIAPIVWALYRHPHLIRIFLGFPSHWPAPLTILHQLVEVPIWLFIHNAASPATWLGTAPVLDAFSIAMLAVGCYYYMTRMRSKRQATLLGAMLLLTAILVAINSPVTFSALLPFLYVLIASGVSYYINLWLTIFPKNPIARDIGWGLFGALILLVLTYHLKAYFIGWPQAALTHSVFTIIQL